MPWRSRYDMWTVLAVVAVGILGMLVFISSLRDPLHGPGGMYGIHFSAVQTALIFLGLPIGYLRKGRWTLVCIFLILVLMNSRMYFSPALYKAVRGAPLAAIAWWIAALLFGIGIGYLGRRKDERRDGGTPAGA